MKEQTKDKPKTCEVNQWVLCALARVLRLAADMLDDMAAGLPVDVNFTGKGVGL